MKIIEALSKIKRISYVTGGKEVYTTVGEELQKIAKSSIITCLEEKKVSDPKDTFYIVIGEDLLFDNFNFKATSEKFINDFAFFKISEDSSGMIIVSKPYLLYSFFRYIVEVLSGDEASNWKSGRVIPTSFKTSRISYDYFLTQGGRTQKNLDREEYIKQLARSGFSFVEVNGLAYPMALETGPVGETYPMFYTYCPALDQYVYSDLNKGIYPYYYLSANLDFLKKMSACAIKYGLTPGLLCFEPRSVPETLFERYPMLRGGRIDHPFRSFKPRYNLTITHPLVLGHYKEMVKKLMIEVPELGYMSIWTNDSGAGYEHTKSLYVGRNGGAYLIREWKNDDEIARLAGENILRFLRTIRDAASEINPDFRVITRMESFYGEHETVWPGLGDRIDVETNTLLARGWDQPYAHPKYPDVHEVNGSPYQDHLDEKEKPIMNDLESRGGQVHFIFSHGPFCMFDPLLGIPYPWLTHKKLKSMHSIGISNIAHSGGITPPNLAPYYINHEIFRLFQFDPEMDIDDAIAKIAKEWIGEKYYKILVDVWRFVEESILAFPIPVIMYSTYGFEWYRLWTRPLVPNIEAIPEKDRAYYEDFMCTTPHNPQNVDLMKDVLFELTSQKRCELAVERMDNNLWPPLQKALDLVNNAMKNLRKNSKEFLVFYDQAERIKALKYWFKTTRNIAAWIAGIHGFLSAKDDKEKIKYREMVTEMINFEIENSKELIHFIENTKIPFMAVSEFGETPLIYGDNLVENLQKKIKLMQEHLGDEPFIDPNYMWKRAELRNI